MHVRFVLFWILFASLTACQSRAPFFDPAYPHYQMDVELDPNNQYIKAEGSLCWPLEDSLSEVSFFLHRQLRIENLHGDHIRSYTIDSLTPAGYAWLPDAAWVHLQLKHPLGPDDKLELFFSYQGRITSVNPYSANAFTSQWTELGLYLPWFLQSEIMPDFTYRLHLSCPDTYRVSGLNEVYRLDNGWQLSSLVPVNDMVILASPVLKSHSVASEGIRIEFDYVSLSDTVVAHMTRDIQEIANWLTLQFGPVPVKTVHIVQSPRKAGGGYARMGGVVLGGIQEEDYSTYYRGYQRYFAHELAHLWWRHAPTDTWHDWINEAFAEFSALMYLRQSFGEGYYEASIEKKRTQILGLPPLWEFDRHDRSHPDAGTIIEKNLYSKGPLLLADLEKEMGRDTFIEFCRELLDHPSIDTDQLIADLSSVSNDSIAQSFKQALKNY